MMQYFICQPLNNKPKICVPAIPISLLPVTLRASQREESLSWLKTETIAGIAFLMNDSIA